MKPLATLTIAMLAVAATAQSPLVVAPTGGSLHAWAVPATSPQTFFDLTVNTTITLQALAAPLVGPVGQRGTIELWLTNPGITTYSGNETNAANWHRAAAGSVIANGTTGSIAQLTCLSCQDAGGTGLVLAPGTYGCAVRYGGVQNQFYSVPALPNVFSTAELSLTGGAIQYSAFATPPASPGGGYAGWSWYGRIHYGNGVVAHGCADATVYGSGCVDRHASIYDTYASAPAAASALDGRAISFVPNAFGAYDVLPGIAIHPYVAPSAAAAPLPVTNDSEYPQALSTPFVHPGGAATILFIHSNGFVSLASNTTLPGPTWLPAAGAFLNAPATGWWIWHDLNPTEPGSGSIWFEEDVTSGLDYVTWLGVESYPAGSANPSTFQMVFDPGTGIVTMNFVALDALGGASSPLGDGWLVGYSPAGASPDPGRTDFASWMGVGTISLLPTEVPPLALAASAKPLIGTTVDLRTTHATGQSLGITFLGFVAVDPGIDLTPLGAPSCSALVDTTSGVAIAISNAGFPGLGMNVSMPIPSNTGLLGAVVYGQSIWLDATANALGIVTSNGLRLKLGNY